MILVCVCWFKQRNSTWDRDKIGANRSCTVALPDGSSCCVCLKQGASIRQVLLELCQKQGINMAAVDLFLVGGEKVLLYSFLLSTSYFHPISIYLCYVWLALHCCAFLLFFLFFTATGVGPRQHDSQFKRPTNGEAYSVQVNSILLKLAVLPTGFKIYISTEHLNQHKKKKRKCIHLIRWTLFPIGCQDDSQPCVAGS